MPAWLSVYRPLIVTFTTSDDSFELVVLIYVTKRDMRIMPSALVALLLFSHSALALKLPASGVMSRRSFLAAPALAALAVPHTASASYAMGVAAQNAQSWEATGKAAEARAYADIEAALEEKRRFRPEEGTLGYVRFLVSNFPAAVLVELQFASKLTRTLTLHTGWRRVHEALCW